MNFREILAYYSREDVQEALLELSKEREVVGVFRNGEFSKRPNTLVYPQDITAMVKSGVQEFHFSIERWSNPMAIKSTNYSDLRTGWDIIFDLDCKDFEHGRMAALALGKSLQDHGIKGFSVKYSGGKGFHLGVPWEAVPERINFGPAAAMYPGLVRKVCEYIKDFTKDRLEEGMLKKWSPEKISEDSGILLGDMQSKDSVIDPWKVVELDSVLVSPRHLLRMPYSLHRGNSLVSLPISFSELKGFRKGMADPSKVKAEKMFLKDGAKDEAELLLAEAIDWDTKKEKKAKAAAKREFNLEKAVPEELFPPCIKLILDGIEDGKKRSVFVLLNFLSSLKWGWDDIERLILEWNSKNNPPLPDNYVRGQIRYSRNKAKPVPPPNCSNTSYYKGYGVCTPDSNCRFVKNPLNYPIRLLGKEKPKRKNIRREPKNRVC